MFYLKYPVCFSEKITIIPIYLAVIMYVTVQRQFVWSPFFFSARASGCESVLTSGCALNIVLGCTPEITFANDAALFLL